ncbi:hypothetical protein [Marinomonas foliarum]|uniref:Uncharacterized protein n=1 Tax=Marinomonas foliarum TaxID=491950 RepID=A0A369ACZ8_9GAMM|nr:hypothetical protein [Marinomonas foliarum]RCX07061.1 hypothetical protein DFP77_107161 [Marinomonas foliarum]
MKLTIDRWGVGLEIGSLIINLFVGDVYVRIPNVGELAYSSAGFYLDHWRDPKKGFKEVE